MDNLILLVFCFLAGMALQRFRLTPPDAPKTLNILILYLALPAVTLQQIPRIELEWSLVYPVASSWLVFAGAWGLTTWVARPLLRLNRAETGCLILTSGLGNTSFVGFPFLLAFYGPSALQYGILTDQPGSFLILATLGVGLAARFRGQASAPRQLLGRVLRFPPFVAFVTAMLIGVTPLQLPDLALPLLEAFAGMLTPLALLSVGLQLRIERKAIPWKPLLWGLGYKLMLAPLIVWALLSVWTAPQGLLFKVSIVESAMAPMITAAIVATDHDLSPRLANAMVGLGIPLSLITAWGWVEGLRFLYG